MVLYLSFIVSAWFSISCLVLFFICLLGSTGSRSWSWHQLIHLLVQCVLHTQLTYQTYWRDHDSLVLMITWVLCVEISVQCSCLLSCIGEVTFSLWYNKIIRIWINNCLSNNITDDGTPSSVPLLGGSLRCDQCPFWSDCMLGIMVNHLMSR